MRRIESLIKRGYGTEAENAAREYVERDPQRMDGQVLLGRALQLRGDLEGAMLAAERAERLEPGAPAARMLRIEVLLQTGETGRAGDELRDFASSAPDNPLLLQNLAQLLSHVGMHADAERLHARCATLAPGDPRYLYDWSSALIALGELQRADELLSRVIQLAPGDADAYYDRSMLRRQTLDRNHVAELTARLAALPADHSAQVALGYALAKEQEDLGDYEASFASLMRAAGVRRRRLSYRVGDDCQTLSQIATVFDATFCQRSRDGYADPRPVFVVGLPRSGTSLVDRILSSHSQVGSRGESSDFALCLMHQAGVRGKAQLIERSAHLDYRALGASYCNRVPARQKARLVDNTPINFMYLPLINAALPNARIIHVRRNPMDACYAMYKTLFRMAYPFSYSLDDLGRYYRAYAKLMDHWRQVLPGAFLELDYEDLVENQEAVSRRLIEWCGLPWEEECLHFERNPHCSLTASAAQVRQPLERTSIGLWQRYARQLEPLAQMLREGGVDVGNA